MKIIFNNFLIETDEIQAISPLTGTLEKAVFDVFLLNKLEPLQLFIDYETVREEFELIDIDNDLWRKNLEDLYIKYYKQLADIWKDKQDKFLTII